MKGGSVEIIRDIQKLCHDDRLGFVRLFDLELASLLLHWRRAVSSGSGGARQEHRVNLWY